MFDDSLGGGKHHLLDLLMKYEKQKELWLRKSENWAKQVQVMPFWTNMYLFRPYTLINHFKVCQMCCQANPVYPISSWTKLNLNGLEIILLIHLKKDQRPIFHMWPSRSFLFNINYLIVVYLTSIHFTTYLIRFIDLVLKLYWVTHVCASFNYSIPLKVTMIWMSITYWLHTHTLYLWNRF